PKLSGTEIVPRLFQEPSNSGKKTAHFQTLTSLQLMTLARSMVLSTSSMEMEIRCRSPSPTHSRADHHLTPISGSRGIQVPVTSASHRLPSLILHPEALALLFTTETSEVYDLASFNVKF